MYGNHYFNQYPRFQPVEPINQQPNNQQYVPPIAPIQPINNNLGLLGKSVDSVEVVKAMDIPLDGITYGISDATFALNNSITNGFANVQNALCQGFNGLNVSYLQGTNSLSSQLANCCCDIERQIADCCCRVERGIDGINYNNAMQTNMLQQTMCNNTRDILENNNNNTRAILDFLTQDKISTLTAENQALRFQASQTAQNAFITANQDAQTAELIRRLGADCPVPAYIVPNPNCCYNYAVTSNNCCNY